MADQTATEDRSASYREVLASTEFRAIFAGSTLSILGDYLAKAAVTALVFADTRSAALAAGAFAISFVPWAVGGPVLAAAASRFPYRSTMIVCDVVRGALIACLVFPGMPVAAMFALLFAASLFDPPFQAARSALLPEVLDGDAYVVGLSLYSSTAQATQVLGYAIGGTVAAFSARSAIGIDAATFGASALLLAYWVRHRPAAVDRSERTSLLRETGQGFVAVFSHPVLRAIALVVFACVALTVIPEALGVAWARHVGRSGAGQGLIMAANPFGYALGGLILVRAFPPRRRQRLIPVFALAPPLILCAAFSDPPLVGVLAIGALGGFTMAGVLAPGNGLFVQIIAPEFRARAFGVMQSGLQLINGLAALGAGALAQAIGIPAAVGLCGLGGVLLIGAVALKWPGPGQIEEAIAARAATAPAS